MFDKLNMHTLNKADEKFKKLEELFPNAVTERILGYDEDNKPIIERAIDKDILMQEISHTVVEGREERYQFTWPDKKKAILKANAPISKTLRPCIEESIGKDGKESKFDSENLYIEGDNLEVLKLLQETYLNKIKMIYIDPPYNTGKDFVYSDKFNINMNDYQEINGDYDEEGNRLVANLETNGRFHTDWLNMIYPRLKIAKDLLSDDGVIFISIDDNEVHNLRKICDEIFGESNFAKDFIRKTKSTTNDAKTGVNYQHEFVLCYAKDKNNIKLLGENKDLKAYKNPDNDPNGDWISDNPSAKSGGENYKFNIINPYTSKIDLPPTGTYWRFSEEMLKSKIEDGSIVFKKGHKENERGFIYKRYVKNLKTIRRTFNSLDFTDNLYMNQNFTKELNMLGLGEFFVYPKGSSFIKKIILHSTKKDDIILDFFSGSSTTAHAMMDLNAEDSGNRKYIMVQIPELTDERSEEYKAGYKNICEIGKERIRCAGKKILEDNEKQDNPQNLSNLDIGFRVLKVDSSNMKDVYYTPEEISKNILNNMISNIKEDRTPNDLLFQIMLDLGINLSSKIEEIEIYNKKVFNVEDNYLMVCLDENITEDVIVEIAKQKPYYFVMRDSSMANDSVAVNFEQIFTTYSSETIRKVL